MVEKDFIALIDARIKKGIQEALVSKYYPATVLSVGVDNKTATVQITGYDDEFTLLNKTGEVLTSGENVFVQAINNMMSNGIIAIRFGAANWAGGEGSSSYTLPVASSSVLGGIKVGSNLSINGSGVLTANISGLSAIGTPTVSGSTYSLSSIGYVLVDGNLLLLKLSSDIDISATKYLNVNSTGAKIIQSIDGLTIKGSNGGWWLFAYSSDAGGKYTCLTTVGQNKISDSADPSGDYEGDLYNWGDLWFNYTTGSVFIMNDSGYWTLLNGGNEYTLPIASTTTLGGIKVGSNLSINENGVLSIGDFNGTIGIVTGSSTFNSTSGRIITHNLGTMNYTVQVIPTANPSGYVGEIWVSKDINTVTVYNSGSSNVAFDYWIGDTTATNEYVILGDQVTSFNGRTGAVTPAAGDYTMAQVGGGNRNLLYNYDFRKPVNQRGASGTISAAGYFLDRWELASGSVTINSGSITLNGTITQTLETAAGTSVHASMLMQSGTASSSYDNATKTFSITSSGGVIFAAKLELGSVSTLANDPPADYGEQLALCQRYALGIGINQRVRMSDYTANYIDFWISTPTTMRIVPSIMTDNFVVDTLTLTQQTGFTFSIPIITNAGLLLRATKTAHGLTDAMLVTTDLTILSADL